VNYNKLADYYIAVAFQKLLKRKFLEGSCKPFPLTQET